MSAQPALVIVPGSFSTSDQYDPIVLPLREKGYTVHIIDPPCYPKNYKAGSTGPPPTMYDDAKFVNEYVGKLVDEGKEVVLVSHSYGGEFKTNLIWEVTPPEAICHVYIFRLA